MNQIEALNTFINTQAISVIIRDVPWGDAKGNEDYQGTIYFSPGTKITDLPPVAGDDMCCGRVRVIGHHKDRRRRSLWWADVRKALAEIKYASWAAAEDVGGDLARLKEVSANMDRAFGLTSHS